MKIRLAAILALLLTTVLCTVRCRKETPASPFRNAEPGAAEYVGMQTCRTCHEAVYQTFIQTGMGQSWGLANREKSAADFSPQKALVYDSTRDLYYRPFWQNDSLVIEEFRLAGRDTVHRRRETVHYIVGSGQHTNSHIININGYLHQAPITFYTQKGRWDLAPGFEKGMNSRFDRQIEMECITCHNGYPEHVAGSLNKYNSVKLGIDCERCHGPGSLHVKEKQAGQIVDTSQGPDYSIVNPRRLSTEAQNSLCQRCHLQGITVLNEGKSFTDFLPSRPLSGTLNTFMPSYSGDEQHMIMASHVERMHMSNCFRVSEKMSCITCHNPHVSVKYTAAEQYNRACLSCHQTGKGCTETPALRQAKQDQCFTCHMPKNGSIDIPHVAVTDHFIRRKPVTVPDDKVIRFLGMLCYSQKDPDARTRARAFLEFHERYEPASAFLDSALSQLKLAGVESENDADPDLIRVRFLQGDYAAVSAMGSKLKFSEVNDGWTAYRIGESFNRMQKPADALPWLQRCKELLPFALDFRLRLCAVLIQLKRLPEARSEALFVQKENPRKAMAWFYLGTLALQEGKLSEAGPYLQQAAALDPDHVQTLINLSVVLYQSGQTQRIAAVLNHALRLEPGNAQVSAMLQDLK
jgi:hypothetical protein